MKDNLFSHDQFNCWQTCPKRYYYKYIKRLNWPDFTRDYELGKNFHALMDYYLRGLPVEHLLKDASEEVLNCWKLIKNHPILDKKLVKTEWGFNSIIGDSSNWLIGRIDAVFFDPVNDKYIIADWKTGKYIPKNIDSNFQHKVYLYALYNCQKDLNLDFSPEKLEFQYVKITDKVHIETIPFSKDKKAEYENTFLGIINQINKIQEIKVPDCCPLKQCTYKTLCF